jgi:hypothetical protein
MGYDADAITVKKGKATFLDDEGNEVNVSVNQLKTYLAQEDALAQLNNQMGDYVDKVEELEDAEKSLAAAYADGKINYEQYSK